MVQHRASPDAGSAIEANGGYVSEAAVIALAKNAGLYLEARSEVNANPLDEGNHEAGVWRLPPSLDLCEELEDTPEWDACAEPWLAIGESDRMTLRFRKPLQ